MLIAHGPHLNDDLALLAVSKCFTIDAKAHVVAWQHSDTLTIEVLHHAKQTRHKSMQKLSQGGCTIVMETHHAHGCNGSFPHSCMGGSPRVDWGQTGAIRGFSDAQSSK